MIDVQVLLRISQKEFIATEIILFEFELYIGNRNEEYLNLLFIHIKLHFCHIPA